MELSLIHNCCARRARYDCPHRISSYTLGYTQLGGFMFGNSFRIRYLDNCFKIFDFVGEVLLTDISYGITYLILFFRPSFGLERHSGYQPLSWSPQFYLWLWRCGFHIVQTVKLLWNIQVYTLVTTLDLLVFLTLRQPQFFMFTDWNQSWLPVNFSSQNIFWVEQPW